MTTREDIFREAVKNYKRSYYDLDPYEIISSRLCITSKNLRAKVSGERHFTLHEIEQFFLACHFPQGFTMLRDFVFHPTKPKASK